MEVTKGLRAEPQRIVIYGPEGIGKSTLASQLPNPVFIDVEGSTSDLDVSRTVTPSSWTALMDMINEFASNHHGFSTLVIDTADWAEKLCISHVCASNNMSALGGEKDFGRSYNLLETVWCRFLDALSRVAASGMHVCLTAHAGVKATRQPDIEAGYDRWELKMERKTAAATKEWARTVLFLNYKTYVVEEKGKKRGTGGQRVMYSSHTPAWDAKNRGGLPDEMRLEFAPLAGLFTFSPKSKQATTPTVSIQPVQPVQPVQPTKPVETKTDPVVHPTPPVETGQASAAFLKPLIDLMKRDSVSVREIQLAVAKRGYYPPDTPLENYDPQFVAGRLVAHWQKVVEMVNQVRQEVAV